MLRPPRAFTLIELLVVITIIVVLLAMLTPALDKAIYAAEMAVCESNLHCTGTSVITYAMDFKRSYPYRAAVWDEATGAYQADSLNYPFSTGSKNPNGYEDRTALVGRVEFKGLVCPLAGRINLAPSSQSTSTWVFANYAMWWGWRYHTPGIGASGNRGTDPTGGYSHSPGMLKLGDRLEYTNQLAKPETYRFNVLASDHVYNAVSVATIESSHPSAYNDALSLHISQDEFNATFAAAEGNPNIRITRSAWGTKWFGGPFDLNYLFDDGSVNRFDKVNTGGDKRMVHVPNSPEGYDNQWLWQVLPDMH